MIFELAMPIIKKMFNVISDNLDKMAAWTIKKDGLFPSVDLTLKLGSNVIYRGTPADGQPIYLLL